MKRKSRNIMITVAVVAVVIIASAVVLGIHSVSVAAYNDLISEGDQLYQTGDYNNAVLKYQQAVEKQPKKEPAYLKVIGTYHAAGYDNYARVYYDKAVILFPNSADLKQYATVLGQGKKKEAKFEVNIDYLDLFASKSYSDYQKTNGIETTRKGEDGAVIVRVKDIAADLIFRNTAQQPAAVSGAEPTENSVPAEIRFDNIMSAFAGREEASFSDLQKLDLSDLKKVNHQEFGRAVTFKNGAYSFVIQSDENGNITGASKNLVTIPAPKEAVGSIPVSGTVTSAVDGDTIGDVTLKFMPQDGGIDNAPIEVVTQRNGAYSVNLEKGDYKVECSAEGYEDVTKEVFVPSRSQKFVFDIALSSSLLDGEVRFVLEWNDDPADLDAHLIEEGGDQHVSFMNEKTEDAELDIDDRNGNGPETITLHNLQGHFVYGVHKYFGSGSLANSGATVTVYMPGRDAQVFTISESDPDADYWVVCEVEDGELSEINTLTNFDSYY